MTTFGYEQSLGYDRRATRLLTGLYRRIATDINTSTTASATVVDLGTGPGKLLSHLTTRRPDLHLHGIDLSPHMIEIARRTLAGHPVELAVADVAELPHPDASIDFAVSSLSMHEWPDLPGAVTELRRVLRPGGGAGSMTSASREPGRSGTHSARSSARSTPKQCACHGIPSP